MLEETETEETSGVFVAFLSLVTFQLGAGSRQHLCAGQFILDIRKLLATSEADFNSLVGGGLGSKPFGTKAAVIFLVWVQNLSLNVKEQEG